MQNKPPPAYTFQKSFARLDEGGIVIGLRIKTKNVDVASGHLSVGIERLSSAIFDFGHIPEFVVATHSLCCGNQ